HHAGQIMLRRPRQHPGLHIDNNDNVHYLYRKAEGIMQDILQGEFFWGVIIGLLLSLLSGYILAQFTVRTQQKTIKETILKFSLDINRNIQAIINETDTTRDRANAIHYDFLNLIDIEIQIYGRNREHIIHIPDEERTLVRKFMNDIAIKKV